MSSILWSCLGRSKRTTDLWYPDEPAYIDVRISDDKEDAGSKRMSVRAFVEDKVKTLKEEFVPTWWLYGGHLQTIYCVIGDFTKINRIHYTRRLLTFPDGGTVALDFAGSESLPDNTPIVVCCHGLAGGSHETYVRNALDPITKSREEGGLGYRAVVANFRGCGGSKLTTPQLYSAGNTDDLRTVLLYLSTRYPSAPLIGIGFSLGACVLTRYLGEEGERSRLIAGCVLACPWDVAKNGARLENNFFIRHTYSKAMGANLVTLAKAHLPTILESELGRQIAPDIDTLLNTRLPTLKTVDRYMTRHLGGPRPPFPFDTPDDYYAWASCHKSLYSVRVPFLCINASDDPIVLSSALPFEEVKHSPWVVLARTHGGGHLGWFTGGGQPPRRWIQTPILEWIKGVAEDYVPPSGRPVTAWEHRGNYIYQVGERPDIGFHEVPGSEEVEGVEDEQSAGVMGGL